MVRHVSEGIMQAIIEAKTVRPRPRLLTKPTQCTTRHQNMMKIVGPTEHKLPTTLFELKQRAANLEVALELLVDDNFDNGRRFPLAPDEERAVVFISFVEELNCIVNHIVRQGGYFYSGFVWGGT